MIIGGHPGLRVERHDGVIVKTAHKVDGKQYYDIALESLARCAEGLRAMAGSGFTPTLVSATPTRVEQQDLGDTEAMREEQVFRRNCIRLLYELRRRGMRHGDLTDRNIIVRGDWPWVIDWQESHRIGGKVPLKQPLSDSALLFGCLVQWKDATGAVDPSRMSRRWQAVLMALGADKDLNLPLNGKTFLDLGCFQGDFVAAARAEGMGTEGVDHGAFQSGEDSIAVAETLWNSMGWACKFTKNDIFDLPADYFKRDVVMMFSTWAWLVQARGGEEAKRVLRQAVAEAGTLFFETQLAGDGPGPAFLPDDNYVAGLLRDCGAREVGSLISIPVPGRPAVRTVWKVRK